MLGVGTVVDGQIGREGMGRLWLVPLAYKV